MKNAGDGYLTANEFLPSGRDGLNQQVAQARWQFLQALQRRVPTFFETLRDDVLPGFAQQGKPDCWRSGMSFARWQSRCDPDRKLTPVLMRWAKRFHVLQEGWILEGALQTLGIWHQFPRAAEALEIQGFRQWVSVDGVIWDRQATAFHLDYEGWDPTLISFSLWRSKVQAQFAEALRQHARGMRQLMAERGVARAVRKFRKEHFDWLALYQCGDGTLKSMVVNGDRTTIFKGIHNAAQLAHIALRTKNKLKKD